MALQVTPERLAGLNAHLRGVRLGNFEFCSEGLFLGSARGNRFEVTLREVDCPQVCCTRCFKLPFFGSSSVTLNPARPIALTAGDDCSKHAWGPGV